MKIPHSEVSFRGSNLVRPECVLCTESGRVYTSNSDGGVSIIEIDGTQWSILGKGATRLQPNGISLEEDGSFLIAHLGEKDGGVYRLMPDGRVEPFVLELEGAPLPPTNFVNRDVKGRVWITVSTRLIPRMRGYRDDNADGFIVLADDSGVRIAADSLGYTNECLLHPDGRRLFVNETFAKRISWFDVAENGQLSNKHIFYEMGKGEFPDGLSFDANGDLWVVCIVANRILRLGMDGSREVIIEDTDPSHVTWVEKAYSEKKMWLEHLQVSNSLLPNISSLAFGGPDLRTVYIGCLLGDQLPVFHSPIAGAPPPHWKYGGPNRI